jgi:drug/metabolite transporter (DMT)-like permease
MTTRGATGAARGRSPRLLGVFAAIGAALGWGLSTTTSDYVLSNRVANDTFLVIELAVGAIALLALGALRGELAGFRFPGLARAAGTGIIEPWGAYTLGNIGIIFSSGAFVALVSALNPVIVAILAAPLLGERVSRTSALLMILSLAGVGLVIGGDAFSGALDPIGVVFSFLGLFCGAAYVLLSSKLVRTIPVLPLVTSQLVVAMLASGVVMFVRVVVLHQEVGLPSTPLLWAAVGATGILGASMPFILYLEATRRLPTTIVSQFTTLVPVIALLGGVALLGDRPSGFQLAGTAVVIGALIALARHAQQSSGSSEA